MKVSFKSGFDFDNALEIEDDDEVELVRRRHLGCTTNLGGFRPLCDGTCNYRTNGKNNNDDEFISSSGEPVDIFRKIKSKRKQQKLLPVFNGELVK